MKIESQSILEGTGKVSAKEKASHFSGLLGFSTLLQKEVLENKTAFIIVPIVTGILLVVMMVVSGLTADVQFDSDTALLDIRRLATMPEDIRQWFLYSLMNDVTLVLRLILVLVSFNYVIGAFFNERRDGSDLFWRSLPINQRSQVLAKWLTVSLVLPLFYFFVIVACQLSCLLLSSLFSMGYEESIIETIWLSAHPIELWFVSLSFVLLDVIWLSPVYLWLLMCSSFYNRAPLVGALIPVLMLGFLESVLLDSNNLLEEFFWHSCPRELMIWIENLKYRVIPEELIPLNLKSQLSLVPNINEWKEAFLSQRLWGGAGLAIVFFIATVKIRNRCEEV
ncbi:MAG: hypothetical protein KUG82_15765 [Pseudomonadales bacterium]|nr:hypothetical protein [Pseudomonadales bacterium]